MSEKDLGCVTEVYSLPYSNPKGKVAIRKGSGVVVIWPGDLPGVIRQLTELKVALDTQHTAE